MDEKIIRLKIFELIKEYYNLKFGKKNYKYGNKVMYAGRIFDEKEIQVLVDSCLDFWLTEGRFSEKFAEKISDFLSVKNVLLCNSGSSANLLALSALTSEKLGNKKLKQGDEVITVAAGFPSTVAPIIQNDLIPVFVDVSIPTYNIDIEMLKKAISKKTRCIFIAHTLGNPFNIDEVLKIAEENDLWVIEDNCDAFGSKYNDKFTGTFGHIGTFSFYPAHHITTGEGGAVITDNDELAQIIRSFRDWGRDCYCAGGENNTCGKRFTQQFGNLPAGYDHKYVYSEIGYNLKMTDMQAAIGSVQIDKLSEFCMKRKSNFKKLSEVFSKYNDFFILPVATEKSEPAWFSFIVSVKEKSPFSRNELINYFNNNNIETRNLFAGNITKQPAFIRKNFRIAEHLENTDFIMNNTFFLGTYPGITDEMINYISDVLNQFIDSIK
ncbi:MAG: lipopolysaccharide biosynthesis protein RfbH [Bacteroidales bacterium]|jgi:CDP-6-deoxy-D-xylo-4-hexulose-3-dehydrase